jgi:drug/metabolite transporter (DMT)-like permease
MKKAISLLLFGLVGLILSSIGYALSFSYDNEGSSIEVSFSNEYLVMMIVFVFLIALGAILIEEGRQKTNLAYIKPILLIVIGIIVFLNWLGIAIQDLVSTGFLESLEPLLIAATGAFVLSLGLFEFKKEITQP